MSADYASRLSEYPEKGKCGLPEVNNSPRVLKMGLKKLTFLVENAKHIVILTGAGISTSAGIPDFRGPKGIWTLEEKIKKQQQNKRRKSNGMKPINLNAEGGKANEETGTHQSVPKPEMDPLPPASRVIHSNPAKNETKRKSTDTEASSFESAKPSFTHHAIAKLISTNNARYCITQNVDGLHRRSGIPREKLSILHGCIFTEKCEICGKEHFRTYDVGGVSCQKTGRKCDDCKGDLRDTVLDWEDELPDPDYGNAQEFCAKSDLVICLGTSLRIEPAGSLPLLARRFVIVNLQATPKDNDAELIIRADVDLVMRELLKMLSIVDVD